MKLVPYYRVSTDKQGRSGLGLEAQQTAVLEHARREGAEVAREFTEIETGKRSDRPVLAQALAYARRVRGTLCIAKLDRLARNVAFTANLMESGVDFIACDNPHANRLTIHILAAVAEDEARRISERTKAALAAYKARGGVLGASRPECRNLSPDHAKRGRRLGAEANREAALWEDREVAQVALSLRGEGRTLRQIAAHLDAEGFPARKGGTWSPSQVKRVLDRHSA